jgi:Flp pilus assembly protein TadD
MDACESEGSGELEAVVEGMKKKDPLSVDERMLNEIGYRLLGNNKTREAVKVFELNVKLYPNSANVYDSLGEALLKAGNKELALKNYEKSLELNPENASAKKVLEELRAK